METDKTSSGESATPTPDSMGATPTASQGATPQKQRPTTLEEALREYDELRRHADNKTEEAARHGVRLTEAEKQLAAYRKKEQAEQEAQLSAVEKLEKRIAEAEQKAQTYQKQLIASHVRETAGKLGIIDAELAALAIEKVLEYGPDGMPTNTEKALGDLIKNKPFLVPEKPAESAPSPAQSSPSTPQAPRIPAMNPPVGRSVIPSPTSSPSPGRPNIPTWSEVFSNKKS